MDHPARAEIERRIKIISFFAAHGPRPAKEAFNVSRSTVYVWKKEPALSGGSLMSLAPGSRAPLRKRKRVIDERVKGFIVEYRLNHRKWGGMPLNRPWTGIAGRKGIKKTAAATIGRLIKDLKKAGRIMDGPQRVTINGRTGEIVGRISVRRKKQRRKG